MTRAEVILWTKLKGRQLHGWQFRRQHPIGRYIADFACPQAKLVIEVDGATHSSYDQIAYDRSRTDFMCQSGWAVHRVWNSEIYDNLDGVLEGIALHLPPPTQR